jgi:hypothetical protein
MVIAIGDEKGDAFGRFAVLCEAFVLRGGR